MPRIITPAPILPIRLIALDIDGTLVGDDLLIGSDTRAAVKAARSRGVVVSLVTGRMVSSAMRFARELGLDAPLVGYQGGLIRDMPDPDSPRIGRLLLHTPLPAAVARDIVEWTRSMGLDPHLNRLERFILRADDPHADDYSAFMGARAELVPDLIEAIRHPITKVLAVADPPLPTDVAPLARERFAGVADVTISHPRFLEFVAPGVSKGRAIRWLARRLQRPARGDACHRRSVERPGDARRGRARGRDADGARRGPRCRPVHRSVPHRGGRRPDDQGARSRFADEGAGGVGAAGCGGDRAGRRSGRA